jgi:N-acetylglutamate synthase-like GNAT family acetyltransferase
MYPELTYREVRPADRERVREISAGVWEGTDYLPSTFEEWVQDPGASFQAAEEDGLVVGLQRLRPIATKLMFYEGLRVAATHRRRGIARTMVRHAVEEARSLGFDRIRLYTGSVEAGELFRSEGFRLLFDCGVWTAGRVEGGDPPRLGSPAEAHSLAVQVAGDPALAVYGGTNASWHGVLDVDAALLERLASEGLVRVGAGGRALALLRGDGRRRLPVTFLAGSGPALQDLLEELRFEADSVGLSAVAVLAPSTHPAAGDMGEVGYDLAEDEGHAYGYQLDL